MATIHAFHDSGRSSLATGGGALAVALLVPFFLLAAGAPARAQGPTGPTGPTQPAPVCGDHVCHPGEAAHCPKDCDISATCGDTVCDPWEDHTLCAKDCKEGCGDAACTTGESCVACPTDCCPPGPIEPECGNNICETGSLGEDSDNCPKDCGKPADGPPPPPPPPPVCGDGSCDLGESPCNCKPDCGPPASASACVCGNGICGPGESCSSCPGDCGSCLPPSTGVCGNATCETEKGETCFNCSDDCGLCPVFDSVGGPPPSNPAEQFDGLDPAFQEHFSLDVSAEQYAAPVVGNTAFEVAAPLASGDGKRNVVYRPAGTSGGTVLSAPNTWNLWAQGVKAPSGKTVVCWNRLVGADTSATKGTMPDPRKGVALICAVDNGSGFAAELVVQSGVPAAWLEEMLVLPSGKPAARYRRDSFGTLINSGKPGDGLMEAVFN